MLLFLLISQVTTGNRTKHYVSYRRNEFVQMRFPKYALPKVMDEKIGASFANIDLRLTQFAPWKTSQSELCTHPSGISVLNTFIYSCLAKNNYKNSMESDLFLLLTLNVKVL